MAGAGGCVTDPEQGSRYIEHLRSRSGRSGVQMVGGGRVTVMRTEVSEPVDRAGALEELYVRNALGHSAWRTS